MATRGRTGTRRRRRTTKPTADSLIASGTAIIGSAKTVRAKIEEVRDKTGLGILVPMLQFGVLSDELAKRSMEKFASEVMPHLRD